MNQREFLTKLHSAKDTLHDIYNSAAIEGQYLGDISTQLDDLMIDLSILRDTAHAGIIEDEDDEE